MEQRKGADRLIAPLAKAASVAILALAAAAVLVLGGCGGDEGSGSGGEPAPVAAERAAAETPSSSQQSSAGNSPASSNDDTDAGGGAATAEGGATQQSAAIAPPSGPREQGLTPEQRETAKVASIALESPAVLPVANGPAELPAAYTCDGKDTPPALRWQGLPSDTEELVLFAMALAPVEGKLFFGWAVAGIDPELEGLEAGRLPRGAVAGRNSFGQSGYSICPPQGQSETYFFALYALPERLSASPGFDPRALRKEVQELSRDVGLLPVSYARG